MKKWVKLVLSMLTAVAVIGLSYLTVKVSCQADGLDGAPLTARLVGHSMFIQLHEEAAFSSAISAMVEQYSAVIVTDAFHDGRQQWYQVEYEGELGWLVSSSLIIDVTGIENTLSP